MTAMYILLFAFIIYADGLDFIPFINYWDEAVTIVCILFCVIQFVKKGKIIINKEKSKCYRLVLIILAIGISGNIANPGIQQSTEAILKDIIAYLKFPILMIALWQTKDNWWSRKRKEIIKIANIVSRITIIAAAILAVVGYVIDIGVYTNEVRMIKCYKYIFSHPTYLVANLIFCIAMLVAENRKKNRYYIYLACVLLFMSQRFKAYAAILIILVLMFIKEETLTKVFQVKKVNTKLKGKYVIPIVCALCIVLYFVFKDKIGIYLTWGMTSARIALMVTCIKIAIDFFPFGSGFGTFASFLSGKYYSGIYSMYGLTKVSGLRIDQYNYISDTFWPWVIGEFGFAATILYIRLFYKLFKNQLASIKRYDKIVGFLILWIYALLASGMEAFFTNSTGTEMALVLTLYLGTDKDLRDTIKMGEWV